MTIKKLILPLLTLSLLGCSDDNVSFTQREPGTDSAPPTNPEPPEQEKPEELPPENTAPSYKATLVSSGLLIKGDVYCNGESLNTGEFTVAQGSNFCCQYGTVDFGSFDAPIARIQRIEHLANELNYAFELTSVKGENATRILKSISTCETELCLSEIDSFEIQDIFTQLDNDAAVEEFLTPKIEESTDEVGKAPSSHSDPTITPAVDPDASNDLTASFVSASAEESLTYKPNQIIKTQGQLVDDNGKPIAGISYFSNGATGVTDENGALEYSWGDEITFGIDTFSFGSVKANQLKIKLSDTSESLVTKVNIQALIERYSEDRGSYLSIPQKVADTFALYPNVINELINLNLPNGGEIDGSGFMLPNEFEAQFSTGLTKAVDDAIRASSYSYRFYAKPKAIQTYSSGYVTEALNKIFANVTNFHVFHDNGSFYGASGYARGMRALNMNNRAFPVVSARTDINKDFNFGESQAWDRDGNPYIATHPTIQMPPIPLISKDNAVYGTPFVTAGEIGAGKVVFMGNGMYPSILSCPENYWTNTALRIDSQAQTCTTSGSFNTKHDDNGSMQTFFENLFKWFNNGNSIQGLNIATNINQATASRVASTLGLEYEFFVNAAYGFGSVQKLGKGQFSSISPQSTPILLLQAYPTLVIEDGMTRQFVADLENPNLSQEDITALINYVNAGGNILFMDSLQEQNPEPIARLADAAGVMLGGTNVVHTEQYNCGSGYFCGNRAPNLHAKGELTMVVIERFEDVAGIGQPFTVNEDGSVEWLKDPTKIKFAIPQYEIAQKDAEGNPVVNDAGEVVMETKYARIFVKDEAEKAAAIKELQTAFPSFPLCTHNYEYEFNCIEVRSGDGITDRGNYGRADFDRYELSPNVVSAMVKSANLGDNFNALYNHEIYYRTKGEQGRRLSTFELNQTYDNLAVWMWNDNDYAYDGSHHHDELGFKTAVEFLNCYTNDQHGNGALCSNELRDSLTEHNMINSYGQLNPSYPLNYMEKPLTRIMLGRSYWDAQITVDTTEYPGKPSGYGSNASVKIETAGKSVSFSAGNRQVTGLWAPQLQNVRVTGGVAATISVMLADNLTGMPNHEKALRRPPRMQKDFSYDGQSLDFQVPYGGLIYIRPLNEGSEAVTFNFDGVIKAPYWKEGVWINGMDSLAPIAEIDTGSFVYTTAKNNLTDTNLNEFARQMNLLAEATSDFYGRDETTAEGLHRRLTYSDLKGFRHHYVNDVQISIGSAHSGYPVMASGFNQSRNNIPTNPLDSWLLWHEFGHNLAAEPFKAEGSTEVTNNLLALYMQEHPERGEMAQMIRLKLDIKKAPTWLNSNQGHAWANADAGLRLVMFGQLKVWAKQNFNIDNWYDNQADKPSIYNDDQGWNMFKLMHRKARGDTQGDTGINFCSAKDTGLSGGDLMMLCSSYVSGYDLSEFFTTWNVGEKSTTTLDGGVQYEGGISKAAFSMMDELKKAVSLKPTTQNNPLKINSIH